MRSDGVGNTDLGQHTQRVSLGGGLDDAPQHEVLRRLVPIASNPSRSYASHEHAPQRQLGRPDYTSTACHVRCTITPMPRPGHHIQWQLITLPARQSATSSVLALAFGSGPRTNSPWVQSLARCLQQQRQHAPNPHARSPRPRGGPWSPLEPQPL